MYSSWGTQENEKKDETRRRIMKDIAEKIDKYLGEAKHSLKDVPSEFMADPLYKNVLTAKDRQSYDKALKTLLSIRGRGAVDALKYAMEKKKK